MRTARRSGVSLGWLIFLSRVMLLLLVALTCAHAEQSDQAAKDMLTRGVWDFHGVGREFKLDGTWSSDNGQNSGHWTIANGTLTIVFDESKWTINFSLPLDPAGTAGIDDKHHAETLKQEGYMGQPKPIKPEDENSIGDNSTPAPTSAPAAVPTATPTPNQELPQTIAQAVAILTQGATWLIPPARRDHIVVFRKDGLFLFFRPMNSGSMGLVSIGSGLWKVENGAVVVREKSGAIFTVKMPVTATSIIMTDHDGNVLPGEIPVRQISAAEMQAAYDQMKGWSPDVKTYLSQITPPKPAKAAAPAAAPETAQPTTLLGTAQPAALLTPTPAPRKKPLSPGDIVRQHGGSLVFVTGTEGAGSGFIVQIGTGGSFLITNVHVAAGIQVPQFQTLDGTRMQPGIGSIGVGEDIFCMSLPAGSGTAQPFEIMRNVNQEAEVGDEVVVLGNAEGGGVINTITGKIAGIGPDLVEVTAPFVPGNSGSPIIHLKTGKVIGVATYLTIQNFDYKSMQEVKNPVVRRFGYRLDTIKTWQGVNWTAFHAQAAEFEAIKQQTDTLVAIYIGLATGKAAPLAMMNPDIKTHFNEWMAAKGQHPSPQDAAENDAEFLAFLRRMCTQDLAAAQGQLTYDYFRRGLADEQAKRSQLANALQEAIREVGQ
jgi:hypothetical protein